MSEQMTSEQIPNDPDDGRGPDGQGAQVPDYQLRHEVEKNEGMRLVRSSIRDQVEQVERDLDSLRSMLEVSTIDSIFSIAGANLSQVLAAQQEIGMESGQAVPGSLRNTVAHSISEIRLGSEYLASQLQLREADTAFSETERMELVEANMRYFDVYRKAIMEWKNYLLEKSSDVIGQLNEYQSRFEYNSQPQIAKVFSDLAVELRALFSQLDQQLDGMMLRTDNSNNIFMLCKMILTLLPSPHS